MKVALTGATGFVGRHVVTSLLQAGHQVRALVRTPAQAALPDEVISVQGDLSQEAALLQLVKGVDVVVHVAGAISAADRAGYFLANVEGTACLVEAARTAKVPRFIHISSLSARAPQLSAYGASKRGGEEQAMLLDDAASVLVIRPPAVYGPGDKATLPLITALTSSLAVLPGRATGRFSLIHVADLAAIITAAVDSARNGLVEVDDGKQGGHSWPELVGLSSQLEDKKITPYYPPYTVLLLVAAVAARWAKWRNQPSLLSPDKVRELYHDNWVAEGPGWPLPGVIDFAQGFAETVAWYRQAGWLPAAKSPTMTGQNNARSS